MWQLAIPIIGSLFDKIFPDKTKADEAKAKLIELQMNGELQSLLGQLEINKEEAKSSSLLVSGWRPFIGWVCGSAFATHYIAIPVLNFFVVLNGHTPVNVAFDMSTLLTVLGGLLGLGTLRTIEKVKGAS